MMMHVRVLWTLLLTSQYSDVARTEKVLGKETGDFDFDGLPGVQFEFKVGIGPGREQCFHQPAREGAAFHLSFEVLRGSDRTVNVYLQDPSYNNVQTAIAQTDGHLEITVPATGTYTICIDNTFSRTASKLVYLHIVTFVTQDWTEFVNEIEEMGNLANNFTTIIQDVQRSLDVVLLHQTACRLNVIKDWYNAIGTHNYIRNWSILVIVVMFGISISTVVFVRRLFRVSLTTPSHKPRA